MQDLCFIYYCRTAYTRSLFVAIIYVSCTAGPAQRFEPIYTSNTISMFLIPRILVRKSKIMYFDRCALWRSHATLRRAVGLPNIYNLLSWFSSWKLCCICPFLSAYTSKEANMCSWFLSLPWPRFENWIIFSYGGSLYSSNCLVWICMWSDTKKSESNRLLNHVCFIVHVAYRKMMKR
jgi:hypothetical protein